MLSIYTNPAQSKVLLTSNISNGIYIISDITGKVVATGKATGYTTKLEIGHLPKAIYLVTLLNDREKVTKQLVKE